MVNSFSLSLSHCPSGSFSVFIHVMISIIITSTLSPAAAQLSLSLARALSPLHFSVYKLPWKKPKLLGVAEEERRIRKLFLWGECCLARGRHHAILFSLPSPHKRGKEIEISDQASFPPIAASSNRVLLSFPSGMRFGFKLSWFFFPLLFSRCMAWFLSLCSIVLDFHAIRSRLA